MPPPVYGFANFKPLERQPRKAGEPRSIPAADARQEARSTHALDNSSFMSMGVDVLGGLGTVQDLAHQPHIGVSRDDLARSQRDLLRAHEEIMELENELRKIRP
jgi:hypothetical protein